MSEYGIVTLVFGIVFLIFAFLAKPTKHKPKHEK